MSQGPLTGIRVVELANFVSAPFATMMLGDLGAEVVKVETAKGDPMRRVGRSSFPVSPLYINSNHGKRSIVLDLKDEGGRRHVLDLLARADVMVSNYRSTVASRLGLEDEDLASANPRLIRVYVTGFGTRGPLAETPTYDSIIQAHYGSAGDRDTDAPPAIASTFVVDKTAAAMVCQATLAALLSRERGGGAARVDIPLLDANAYVNFPDMMANRTFVDDSPREAINQHAAATRPIRAADGWMMVVPVTADQIRRTFAAVGTPDLADDVLAIRDATELITRTLDALEERTVARPVAEWIEIFNANDVPAGACLTIDQHLDDPQVRQNQTYGVAEWEGLGHVRYARYPARFSNWAGPTATQPTAPPTPGEHTAEILEELTARPAAADITPG